MNKNCGSCHYTPKTWKFLTLENPCQVAECKNGSFVTRPLINRSCDGDETIFISSCVITIKSPGVDPSSQRKTQYELDEKRLSLLHLQKIDNCPGWKPK